MRESLRTLQNLRNEIWLVGSGWDGYANVAENVLELDDFECFSYIRMRKCAWEDKTEMGLQFGFHVEAEDKLRRI